MSTLVNDEYHPLRSLWSSCCDRCKNNITLHHQKIKLMRALVLTTLQHPHIWMASTKYSSCNTWIPLLPTVSASGDGLYRRRALKAPNIIIYQFTAMDKWVQPGDGLISLQSSLSPNHWFLGSTSQLLTLTNTQSNGAHLYSNTLSVHLSLFCSSLSFP